MNRTDLLLFGQLSSLPKVKISLCDGINPCPRIQICDKYLLVHGTSEEQKVEVASLYLGDVVDVWYLRWLAKVEELEWKLFVFLLQIW